jgi:hypothetical protein
LHHLRPLVLSILTSIAIFCFAWPIYLDVSYPYTMPTSPQPSEGKIHRLVVSHGSVVFVTDRDLYLARFVFNYVFFGGVAAVALVGTVLVYWKPKGTQA